MSEGKVTLQGLRMRAMKAVDGLRASGANERLQEGRGLLKELRAKREFGLMTEVAEAVVRHEPEDHASRIVMAQGLIETGLLAPARDTLSALVPSLPEGKKDWTEAMGLLGRVNKQLFADSEDKASASARNALGNAITFYSKVFARNPDIATWHGVNLAALLHRAQEMGLPAETAGSATHVAGQIMAVLDKVEDAKKDNWHHATYAEAAIAHGDWDTAVAHLKKYVDAKETEAFNVGSTLRQFTQIWDLDKDPEHGQPLLNTLRARIMTMDGGEITLSPEHLREIERQEAPTGLQVEALLGPTGTQTYQWWQEGMKRARSVASISIKIGEREGTGFLVRAGDFGLTPPEELVVLTNYHVVNPHSVPLDDITVAFEVADPEGTYGVVKISPCFDKTLQDASFLWLDRTVTGIEPLPLAAGMPLLNKFPRVYVIGYTGGRELSFSFQDNALLDHEEPPDGKPLTALVRRVHYRAPTEGGNSGSPVFNEGTWRVLALHHAGGKGGVEKLNQKGGYYAANEGISIACIKEAIATLSPTRG